MITMPMYRVEVKLRGEGDVTVEELWTHDDTLPEDHETAYDFVYWFWLKKDAMEVAHQFIADYGIKALV